MQKKGHHTCKTGMIFFNFRKPVSPSTTSQKIVPRLIMWSQQKSAQKNVPKNVKLTYMLKKFHTSANFRGDITTTSSSTNSSACTACS